MPTEELSLDVAIGVTIPARDARGRAARLGPVLDEILSAHNYPPVIERLLAEALTLTALLGSLLKDPQGQMTLQAQTENGAIDLLVCDYLGGELRGYVRHDPERLADAGPNPSLFALFGKGYLAITFDQPVTDERYQGIVPLEGDSLGAGRAELFRPVGADPEPRPPRGGKARRPLVRRRHPVPAFAGRRGGAGADPHPARPSGLAARRDPRRIGEAGGADRSRRFRWTISSGGCSTRKRRCGPSRRSHLRRGCRCDPDYVRSVIARFPEEERQAMVGQDGFITVDCAFCSTELPDHAGRCVLGGLHRLALVKIFVLNGRR